MKDNQHLQSHEFDFDWWSEMSKRDPECFEKMRMASINELISNVPAAKQQRLRCLQWKIDRVRDKMATPMAACVAISDMMWDSLGTLNTLYQNGDRVTIKKNGKRVYSPMPSAKIIQFSPSQ